MLFRSVLPKVDATNVGDMTLLLMSGIKTVAVQGHLLDKPRAAAQPKESDISHDIVPYRNENGPKEAGGPVNTL